ncbi:MAG: hypothetical protein GX442_24380 [Candidatus Riflebacteria bacterium]|nr:hypothetical protein [Candidatus Riflebacteria bacterium]
MPIRLLLLLACLWGFQELPVRGETAAGPAVSAAGAGGLRHDLKPTFWVRGMPDAIQTNSYTCGVAVFQAVAQYFDHWGYQETYARELGATPEDGTHPAALLAGFRRLGLTATLEEGLTIEALERHLRAGTVVIVDYQAWNGKPAGKDYSTEWEDGHYSILIGFNDTMLFLEDPSTLGTVGYLTRDDFRRRWHDYEVEDGKRREYRQMAIFVRGPSRRQPHFTPID